MPQNSLLDFSLKLGLGETGADLLLERNPPERRVLNAFHRHLANRLADAGHGNRQEIHQKSGIDSRCQYGNAVLFRQFVDLARYSRIRLPRIAQLLAGRYDMNAKRQHLFQLVGDSRQSRTGRQQHHIRGLPRQRLGDIRLHRDAQRRQARQYADILADFGRIGVHRADNLQILPLRQIEGRLVAYRPESHLNHLDFFHLCLPPFNCDFRGRSPRNKKTANSTSVRWDVCCAGFHSRMANEAAVCTWIYVRILA